jgi:replicative DNA helicase
VNAPGGQPERASETQPNLNQFTPREADVQVSPWTAPVPLSGASLPAFPTTALPDWLREFVEAEAWATQTPPDLAGMLVLAALATACSKMRIVRITRGYVEPLNLFTLTVLPPGNRKSAVFRDVVAPLASYEKREAARLHLEIVHARSKRAVAEKTLRDAEKAAAEASDDGREELLKRVESCADALARISVPPVPRLIADDCTPEKLASLLAEQGGRMAVLSPEGDVFELMAGRYSANSGPNFAVFIKGHSGDDLRVDRGGRPPEFVSKPALTIGLTVQPDVLQSLHGKTGFRGRGLLARFLYSLPESPLGWRKIDPAPVPADVAEAYAEGMCKLLDLPSVLDPRGKVVATPLELDVDAARRRSEFETRIERELAPDGSLGSVADWGGKLVGAVTRVAGLLHLAEHYDHPTADRITGRTMAHAIEIGEYLIPHARASLERAGFDPAVGKATILLAWIERKLPVSFSEREIFEGTKGRFDQVEKLRPGLATLVDRGYLRRLPAPVHPGPGRKPSPEYEVNPLLASHNSHYSQVWGPAASHGLSAGSEQGEPGSAGVVQ